MPKPVRLDPTILREYDIRGVIDDTLDEDVAYTVGRAFGTAVVAAGTGDTVAIGRDGRDHSPRLADACAQGMADCGLQVIEIGLGPTPMLYFTVFDRGLAGGLQITGSHNPPDYNGFKMLVGQTAIYGADIRRFGQIAAEEAFAAGSGTRRRERVLEAYVDRILADYAGGPALKVAWDAGNGAAGEAMRMVTDRLPGTHVLLFEEIDGSFPNHHPDPTVEKNLVDLRNAVAAHGCDFGVAFDGDGDRIGVIDNRGRVLWGDQIIPILAREVLAEHPGATIIADVKASSSLFETIEKMGGLPLMWKTGHSLVKAKMKETGSPLAGEMSGHIFYKHKFYGYDDALYVAVRLLGVVGAAIEAGEAADLAGLRDMLPETVSTPEMRFDCPEDRKFKVIDEVAARLAAAEADVVDVDGVRVNTPDGWWLLRASNTQPVLVARCEAGDAAGLERLREDLKAALAESGVDLPEDAHP